MFLIISHLFLDVLSILQSLNDGGNTEGTGPLPTGGKRVGAVCKSKQYWKIEREKSEHYLDPIPCPRNLLLYIHGYRGASSVR